MKLRPVFLKGLNNIYSCISRKRDLRQHWTSTRCDITMSMLVREDYITGAEHRTNAQIKAAVARTLTTRWRIQTIWLFG